MLRRLVVAAAAALVAIVLVAAAGIAALHLTDIEASLRGPIERRLEALLGRPVTIAGRFELVPSIIPTLSAEQLRVANVPGGSEPAMLQAERIEFQLRLLPLLLDGDVLVDRLVLVHPDVLVETDAEGRLNWASLAQAEAPAAESAPTGAPATEGERRIVLTDMSIRDGELRWRDGDRTETFRLDRFAWEADAATGELALDGAGNVLGRPFALSGTAGSLSGLWLWHEPYPLALEGKIGEVTVRIKGEVVPATGAGSFDTMLAGEHVAALSDLVGAKLPKLGPYNIQAQIVSDPEDGFTLPAVRLAVGAPDWAILEAKGSIAGLAPVTGIDGRATLKGESVAAFGQRLGLDWPDIGPYRLEGRITGTPEDLVAADLDGTVTLPADGSTVELAGGHMGDLLALAEARLPLSGEGPSLRALAAVLGFEIGEFGPYAARTLLVGRLADFVLNDLDLTAGDEAAHVAVRGDIAEPLKGAGFALDVRTAGKSLAGLSELVGADLPPAGPYEAAAHVTGSADKLNLEELRLTLGGSTLTGTVSLALAEGAAPQIEGTVVATKLDLDDLAELGGKDEAGDGVVEMPVDFLTAVEAHLAVRADRLVVGGVEAAAARAGLHLADGKLRIEDLVLHAAGGTVTGDASMERQASAGPAPATAAVSLRLNADGIDIEGLLSGAGTKVPASGTVDLDLNLNAAGRTLDALLAELEGDATLVSEKARVEGTQLNWLVPDMDILRLLPIFWNRSDAIRINCLIADFDIEQGIAEADALLDTRRMTLLGDGTVNLRRSTVDLALEPKAKGGKLSAAAVPVDIEGPLNDPKVKPRADEAMGRLLGGVLGGLLVPLNQLAGLFGREATDACGQALGRAREGRKASE